MGRITPFSIEDIKTIITLRQQGCRYREIAEAVGRNIGSISFFFAQEREDHRFSKKLNEEKSDSGQHTVSLSTVGQETTLRFSYPTPRQMIKKLYDMGYRIENNKLVCIVKQTVDVQDIIKNG